MNALQLILVAVVLRATSVALCDAKDPNAHKVVRDGSSFDKAIIVTDHGPNEVKWEVAQMRRFHPDAEILPVEQGLASHNGRLYDVWVLKTPHGEVIMFFDIGEDK
jgi:hypothetical protein